MKTPPVPSSSEPSPTWAQALERHVAHSAEYLLLAVLGLVLWMAGFVDLFTHTSQPATVLGRYSLPFTALLLAYGLGFLVWGWFIFRRTGPVQLRALTAAVQRRSWLGLAILLASLALVVSMFLLPSRWVRFPLLEIALLLLVLLINGALILARPVAGMPFQRWRKVVAVTVAGLIVVELLLQGAAVLRLLPLDHTAGLFTPYGRIYRAGPVPTHAIANQNGWYYPNVRARPGAQRIVLVGGAAVLGLAVAPGENMGVQLDQRLRAAGAPPTEVHGMGVPDYGPIVYLAGILYPYTAGKVEPHEVIVFIHLVNDFQTIEASNGQIPLAIFDGYGALDVPPGDFELRHDLWHTIIRGYDPQNPVDVVKTHLFTLTIAEQLARSWRRQPPVVSPGYANLSGASAERPFGQATFLFEPGNARTQHALDLAIAGLDEWRIEAERKGTRVRLVTLPYFPPAFYGRYRGADWRPELDRYDLLLPERALQRYATERGLSFLSLGQYMRATGLPVEQIRALYQADDQGQFTAAGHRYVAEAIASCFYRPSPTECR